MRALCVVAALFALGACNREGPAEKAGRSIDQAAENTGKAMDKAAKSVRDAVTPEKK